MLDIFINFNTVITDEQMKIIDDRKVIAQHYLKSWFLIDVLAIIPFDLLISGGADQDNHHENETGNVN